MSLDARLTVRLSRESRAAARRADRQRRAYEAARARAERAVLAARRRLPVRAGGAVVAALMTVPVEGSPPLLWLVSGVCAVGAARSYAVLRSGPGTPQAPAAPPPPLPPRGSATRPAVVRLEAARTALVRLVPLVPAAGRKVVEQAWAAAGDADTALRWQAARIAAVEPHRGAEADLMAALEDGVAAQERVVAAVADLVSAGALPGATARVHDAADRLHGLAAGLREVR